MTQNLSSRPNSVGLITRSLAVVE